MNAAFFKRLSVLSSFAASFVQITAALALFLLLVSPVTIFAKGPSGRISGGGGGRSSGGGFSGGGSRSSARTASNFSRSSGYSNSAMRSAPSRSSPAVRSASPTRNSAPVPSGSASRANSVSRSPSPSASDANHIRSLSKSSSNQPASRPSSPSITSKPNATANKTIAPQSPASSKRPSPTRLQHVNSNLNQAIKPAATQRGMQTTDLHASSLTPSRSVARPPSPQADTIRHNWSNNRNHKCFNNNWWIGRPFIGVGGIGLVGGWGYSPWLNYHPWSYWWNRLTWSSCVAYIPDSSWNEGYYYDYGPGGNVVFNNNQVAVDGRIVATKAEFAETATDLAEVDAAELTAVPPADWMSLGTFSMAVSDNEVDPARVIQLAVSKNGLISGTIHNRSSGNTYAVQGRIDKETQRVAFTIGTDRNTVLETGIYNLTQDQTPLLCHFGNGQQQVYLLARLPQPAAEPVPPPAPQAAPAVAEQTPEAPVAEKAKE